MGRNFGGHSARLGPMPPAGGGPTDPGERDSLTAIIFKHSLFWDYNAGGADANSVDRNAGQWMLRMAQHMGKTVTYEAQFGQHHQWSMPLDNPTWIGNQARFNPRNGADIVAAGVDTLIFTPDNFARTGTAPSNHPDDFTSGGDRMSYVEDVIAMVDAFEAFPGAPTPRVLIYDNWPKPPSTDAAGLAAMKAESFGHFRSWAHQLRADVLVHRPDMDIELIHSAEIFADVMDNTAASSLTYNDWFRDNAPHGNPAAYLVAGAILFRQLFGVLPLDFVPQVENIVPLPAVMRNNWASIAAYIDTRVGQVGQNLTPGPVCTIGPDATYTLAPSATGTGLDLTFTGKARPVAATRFDYSTDNGASWRDLGAIDGTVTLTRSSSGANLAPQSSVTLRLRAANTVGLGVPGDRVTATTASGSGGGGGTAPSVTGSLLDRNYQLDSGTHSFATAPAFSGSGLSFAITPATTGVSINGQTGQVTVNTAQTGALAGRGITVQATNVYGSATTEFSLTISQQSNPGLAFVETTTGQGNLLVYNWRYQEATGSPSPRLTVYARINVPSVQRYKTALSVSGTDLTWDASGGFRWAVQDSAQGLVGEWAMTENPSLGTDYIAYIAIDLSAPTAQVVFKPVSGVSAPLIERIPIRSGSGFVRNDSHFSIGTNDLAFGFAEIFVQYGAVVPLSQIESNIYAAGAPHYLIAGQRANESVSGDPGQGVNDLFHRGSAPPFNRLGGAWTDQ